MPRPPIASLVGPTGVGKTSLALALAEEHGAEIVNADALQVYRGFDIGTAKPTPQERARAPHHLVDILKPEERYSAGEFARRARSAIDEIHGGDGGDGGDGRGRPVLVVGGSGLYHRALFEGLSPVPPGDPDIRRRLRERLAEEGLEPLAAELAAVDPPTASRLAPGDTQRVLRALEVAAVSGVPLSRWIERQPQGSEPLPAIHVGLTLPRPVLYDAIERRTTKMLEDGWLQEVEQLLESGLSPDVPAFQAIGYRELARHLEGKSSLEEAIEETIRSTRRYAKRQMTWFRKLSTVQWLDSRMIDPRSLDVF